MSSNIQKYILYEQSLELYCKKNAGFLVLQSENKSRHIILL